MPAHDLGHGRLDLRQHPSATDDWFRAIWLVTNGKDGMSALGLKRALGQHGYEAHWVMLHKLRRAMVRPGRDKLSGEVEVDESFVGAPTAGARGRGTARAIVAIACECKPAGKIGRIRLAHIPDTRTATLEGFCLDNIELGSLINTDGFAGYRNLGTLGYTHTATAMTGAMGPAHVVMPRVHRVASLLKRWLLGTHQGGLSHWQLDYYLDEFVFRFNRRTSRSRGSLFLRLIQQGLATPPVERHRIRRLPLEPALLGIPVDAPRRTLRCCSSHVVRDFAVSSENRATVSV